MSIGGGALSTTAYYFFAYFFASSSNKIQFTFGVFLRIRRFANTRNDLITDKL